MNWWQAIIFGIITGTYGISSGFKFRTSADRGEADGLSGQDLLTFYSLLHVGT
jgi:hypothetical protein